MVDCYNISERRKLLVWVEVICPCENMQCLTMLTACHAMPCCEETTLKEIQEPRFEKIMTAYHAVRKIPGIHAGVETIGKKVDLCFRNQKGNFCKSNAHLFAWQWKIWPNIELIFCILYSHKCVLGLFWLWPTLAGRHLKTNGLIWQWASQPERISHLFYSSHLDVFPAKYINCMIYLDFS